MHAATKKTRHSHPVHLRGNGHAHKKLATLTQKIENMYSHSMRSVKRKPYQAAGALLLGVGVISSLYIWYRFIK